MNREKLSQEEKVDISEKLVGRLREYCFEDALYIMGSTLALMGLHSKITSQEMENTTECGAALCNLMGRLNNSGDLQLLVLASALVTLSSNTVITEVEPEVENE